MVSGLCSRCGREIGGFLRPSLWQCPVCKKIWCETCPKRRVGRMFKKLLCPDCRIEMREGGLATVNQAIRGT
jgi:hypothetical protein